MKKSLLSITIASVLSLSSVLLTPSYASVDSCESISLGMNLPHEKYFNPAWMFVDLMKGSKPFESRNITDRQKTTAIKSINMDENGYPLVLPTTVEGFSEPQYIGTVLGEIGLNPEQQERYTLYYEGTGEISLGAVENIDSSESGKISFDFPKQKHIDAYLATGKAKTSFTLNIKASTAGDHIRNIRVMRPNFSAADSEASHPLFHQRLAGFSTLRFMDTLNTNRSNHETVDDITSKQQATQFKGVSPYYVAKIANENNSNAWINIPHRATDEFVRSFAQTLKAELNPDLKVYIEYSNEVWNSLFKDKKVDDVVTESGQYTYVTAQGCANPVVAIEACEGEKIDGKEQTARFRQYTKRSLEIFKIFDSVFANEPHRAVSVLAGQAASASKTRFILEALDDTTINPSNYQVDSFAIAPYFGGKFTRDMVIAQFNNASVTMGSLGGTHVLASEITQEQFLDEMTYLINNDVASIIQTQKALIDPRGMDLVAYEGGQHIAALGARLTKWDEKGEKIRGYEASEEEKIRWKALFDAHVKFTGNINRHPRMKTLYSDYFKQWFDLGGKDFMAYSYISANGAKSGSWGVLETQNQAIEDAPKYAALRELLDESSCPINTETSIEVNGTVYPDGSRINVVPNQAMSVKVSMNKANVSTFKHRIPARLRIRWADIANIQMDENVCKPVGNQYTIYRIECSNPPQGMTINYTGNMVTNLKESKAYTVTEFTNGDKEVQKQYFVPTQ